MNSLNGKDVPIIDFAEAMRRADRAFGERVRAFEQRFGGAHGDTLGVLAQANYLCWYGSTLQETLLNACEAIGKDRPSLFRSCLQISPERWDQLHAYIIGVQLWLGIVGDVPEQISHAKVQEIQEWLGEHQPAKDALAALFVHHLALQLLHRASLGSLTPSGHKADAYTDYTAWYRWSAEAPYNEELDSMEVTVLQEKVREAFGQDYEGADEILEHVCEHFEGVQPPCMGRFQRYQEVKIGSIGAMHWRGFLPEDDGSKARTEGVAQQAQEILKEWILERPATTELGEQLYKALGKRTDRRIAIVRDFLLGPKNSPSYYYWLDRRARTDGSKPAALFCLSLE